MQLSRIQPSEENVTGCIYEPEDGERCINFATESVTQTGPVSTDTCITVSKVFNNLYETLISKTQMSQQKQVKNVSIRKALE